MLGALLCTLDVCASELDLSWEAPSGCPDKSAVLARVERLVSRRLMATATPSLVALVEVKTRREGDWSLFLGLGHDGTLGTKTLQGQSCEELADAAALFLSLALASARRVVLPVTQPTAVVTEEKSHDQLWGAAAARLDVGILALPSFRAQLSGILIRRALRLELFVAYGFSRSISDTPRPGTHLEQALPYSGGVKGCVGTLPGLFLCGGADLGVMNVSAVGITEPAKGSAPWSGLLGSLLVRIALGPRTALRAEILGGLCVVRPSFVIEGRGEVFQAPLLFGGATVGLENQLW